jgi:hypothetical protein
MRMMIPPLMSAVSTIFGIGVSRKRRCLQRVAIAEDVGPAEGGPGAAPVVPRLQEGQVEGAPAEETRLGIGGDQLLVGERLHHRVAGDEEDRQDDGEEREGEAGEGPLVGGR